MIATGGRPRSLQSLEGMSSKVSTFRSLVDFEKLDELTTAKGGKSRPLRLFAANTNLEYEWFALDTNSNHGQTQIPL